ncbi:MAG TPA: hypothetical protein VNZ52_11135, partial [Candidatus Thermoplasmatota archaeon]|nr:hypothetical protein [Candidatus Thermoplasmatota archaeon]
MPSIDDYLYQAFERKGYRVTTNATVSGGNSALYHVPLLAQAGHQTILVDWNTTEILTRAELNGFVQALRETGAQRGIFLALNGWEAGIPEEATAQDVEVWDHART